MAHLKVYYEYVDKLIEILPMEDVTFTTKLRLPTQLESQINAQNTTADKASYFLKEFIKKPLDIGYATNFDNLLIIMENCGYNFIKEVAIEMKLRIGKLKRMELYVHK